MVVSQETCGCLARYSRRRENIRGVGRGSIPTRCVTWKRFMVCLPSFNIGLLLNDLNIGVKIRHQNTTIIDLFTNVSNQSSLRERKATCYSWSIYYDPGSCETWATYLLHGFSIAHL